MPPRPTFAPEVSARATFNPVRLMEVNIGIPIPDVLPCESRPGQRYMQALSLVWLHERPLGLVELAIPESGMSAEQYAQAIWSQRSAQIRQHLAADGFADISSLPLEGIQMPGIPRCCADTEALHASGPFVSVVIPTHNRPERIVNCVSSLLQLDYPHFEIIVADNGPSSSATVDAVHQHFSDEPRVQYVCEARAGTSRARNLGLARAKGSIIAFCDDDVRHHPRWLTELVRGFEAGPRVACVTGLVLPQELETIPQLWLEQYGGYSKGFDLQVYDLAEHMPQDRLFPFTTGRLGTGANMAFRTTVARAIGGFDPALGGGSAAIGGEDLALSFQVIAAGYQLVYQPAAVVYHPHYREYAALCKQMFGYGTGLTAYLTKCAIDHPRLLVDILRRLPLGLAYVLNPRSPKNRKKTNNYPRELTIIELKGMARGPFAYLRGRLSHRREKRIPPPDRQRVLRPSGPQNGPGSPRELLSSRVEQP